MCWVVCAGSSGWWYIHTTVQRRGGEAWLAWMIRSKDSLFSHCSLTTTPRQTPAGHRIGGPPPSRRRRRSLFFACTGHSAMSSLGLCCCLPACARRCSVLAACLVLGGDGCVGCLCRASASERARTRPLCLPSLLEFPPPFSHPLFNYPSTYPTHLATYSHHQVHLLSRVPLYTRVASPVKD